MGHRIEKECDVAYLDAEYEVEDVGATRYNDTDREARISEKLPTPSYRDPCENRVLINECVRGLSVALAARDKDVCFFWIEDLWKLRKAKVRITIGDRCDIVRLLLEMLLISDDIRFLSAIIDAARYAFGDREKQLQLLKNCRLRIRFRPILDIVQRHFFAKERIEYLASNISHCTNFFEFLRTAQLFFPETDHCEILAEFRPKFCPWDMKMIDAAALYSFFAPYATSHWKEIAEEALQLLRWSSHFWSVVSASTVFLLSNIAATHNGSADRSFWDAHIPDLFSVVLNIFPIKISGQSSQRHRVPSSPLEEVIVGSYPHTAQNAAKLVANIIQNDNSTLDHLEKLMRILEPYFHPSNIGPWSSDLSKFVQTLSFELVLRTKNEKKGIFHACKLCASEEELLKHETCECPKFAMLSKSEQDEILSRGVENKLSGDSRDRFVDIVLPSVLYTLYSKNVGIQVQSASTLAHLATLSHAKVISRTLPRFLASLSSVTSPHQVEAALDGLTQLEMHLFATIPSEEDWEAVSHEERIRSVKALSTLSLYDIDGGDVELELNRLTANQVGFVFLPDILELTLPGIDAADSTKTALTFMFYLGLVGRVMIEDGLPLPPQHVLSEEEGGREGSSSFPDGMFESWTMRLLDQLFYLFETAVENPQQSGSQSRTDRSLKPPLHYFLASFFSRMSRDIYAKSLNKVVNLLSESFLKPALKDLEQLILSVVTASPQEALDKILPLFLSKLIDDKTGEILQLSEGESVYWLNLLSAALRAGNHHSAAYIGPVLAIVKECVQSDHYIVVRSIGGCISDLLSGLLSCTSQQGRNVPPEVARSEEYQRNFYSFTRNWKMSESSTEWKPVTLEGFETAVAVYKELSAICFENIKKYMSSQGGDGNSDGSGLSDSNGNGGSNFLLWNLQLMRALLRGISTLRVFESRTPIFIAEHLGVDDEEFKAFLNPTPLSPRIIFEEGIMTSSALEEMKDYRFIALDLLNELANFVGEHNADSYQVIRSVAKTIGDGLNFKILNNDLLTMTKRIMSAFRNIVNKGMRGEEPFWLNQTRQRILFYQVNSIALSNSGLVPSEVESLRRLTVLSVHPYRSVQVVASQHLSNTLRRQPLLLVPLLPLLFDSLNSADFNGNGGNGTGGGSILSNIAEALQGIGSMGINPQALMAMAAGSGIGALTGGNDDDNAMRGVIAIFSRFLVTYDILKIWPVTNSFIRFLLKSNVPLKKNVLDAFNKLFLDYFLTLHFEDSQPPSVFSRNEGSTSRSLALAFSKIGLGPDGPGNLAIKRRNDRIISRFWEEVEERGELSNDIADICLDVEGTNWKVRLWAITILNFIPVTREQWIDDKVVGLTTKLLCDEIFNIRTVSSFTLQCSLVKAKQPSLRRATDEMETRKILSSDGEARLDREKMPVFLLEEESDSPTSLEELWKKADYEDHNYYGWYSLPKRRMVYKYPQALPESPLREGEAHKENSLSPVWESFLDEDFFTKYLRLIVSGIEHEMLYFQRKTAIFLKGLFAMLHENCLDLGVRVLEKFASNMEDKESQLIAAIMFGAIVRGSKHWPLALQMKMQTKMTQILSAVIDEVSEEFLNLWADALLFCVYDRDIRRISWLYTFLVERLTKERSLFTTHKCMELLLGFVNEATWRADALHGKLLDFLIERLDDPYSIVRTDVARLLQAIASHLSDFQRGNSVVTLRTVQGNSNMERIVEAFVTKFNKHVNEAERTEEGLKSFEAIMETLTEFVGRATFSSEEALVFNPYLIQLLPLLVGALGRELLEDNEACHNAFIRLSFVTATKELIDSYVNILTSEAVGRSPRWKVKKYTAVYLQFFLVKNAFLLSDEHMERIGCMLLEYMDAVEPELKNNAINTYSGFLRIQSEEKCSQLLVDFRTMALSGCDEARGSPLTSQVERAVFGLCAFVLRNPYSLPSWMPEVLVLLSKFFRRQSAMMKEVIMSALKEFWRTHQDTWETDQLRFTFEQLEYLTETIVSPSYFS